VVPAVPKIEQHREEFLAPGSVEYGLGSGSGLRWLTPEDLENEFGGKAAQKMIDDYDLDTVNNMKRSLEQSAKQTAIGKKGSSSPPPPVPNRSNRAAKEAAPETAVSPRAAAASPSKADLSPRANATLGSSGKQPQASATPVGDKKQIYKEKLQTLKDLHEDGLIDKEEYDRRRNALVDEMLN
jgi:hypothetical protein